MNNKFAGFFVERPVLAWVMALIIMLAGVVAVRTLPIAQYPDVAPPSVMITAAYPGASAQVVENSITQILEQEIKGLDGLLYFNSTSNSSGLAEIMLTFQHGTDPDMAAVQVQNRVAYVTQPPARTGTAKRSVGRQAAKQFSDDCGLLR